MKRMFLTLMLVGTMNLQATNEELKTVQKRLFLGAFQGISGQCKQALKEGAHVDAKNVSEHTALMGTLQGRGSDTAKCSIVQLFISQGADLNQKSSCGTTALMWAAETGNAQIANLLINAGADIDAHTNARKTALMMAAHYGHDKVVKLLIDKGAKQFFTDNSGHTAGQIALYQRHTKVAELLGYTHYR